MNAPSSDSSVKQGRLLRPGMVSIVMPCFNREDYVASAIASLQAQTYQNWELIAVDDGSTDRTFALLKIAESRDPRIHVLRHDRNSGRPAIARNTGLAHACGEYLSFLDSDDTYLPEKTQTLLEFLQRNEQCVVAFSDMLMVNDLGAVTRRYLPRFLEDAEEHLTSLGNEEYLLGERFFLLLCLRYCAIGMNSCIVARTRIQDVEIYFDPSLTMGEDKDLWIRLAMSGTFGFLNKPLATYRMHDGNITKRTVQGALDEIELARRNRVRAATRVRPDDELRLKINEANAYSQLGWVLRKAGSNRRAFLAYLGAFGIVPSWRAAVNSLKSLFPVRET